jgi:protein-disulfide isomerase
MPLRRRYYLLGAVFFVSMLPGTATAQLQSQCFPLDEAARAKLIQYIHKKQKIGMEVPIELVEAGYVRDSCYRKLRFRTKDAGKPLNLTLYASPDLRFLTRSLMDVTVDPAEEERRQKLELVAKLSQGGAPIRGSKTAPVTITVFSDFQCPFCSGAAKGLGKDILPSSAGGVRIEHRYFPLGMHAWARPAAEAAECARQQGERYFWDIHDYFFEHQKELKPDSLKQSVATYAAGLSGFDSARLKTCMDEKATAAAIDRDIALGREVGVTGTPTIFVNGERITGYHAEQLHAMIADAQKQ